MATAAEIQLIRNADPGAVLPGIDTPTGNPLPSSSLLDYTKITQNAKGSPYYYNPATGLGHPRALGEFHSPAFQRGRALERFGQDRVGGLIERRAHRGIADLADPPAVIRLPRLILLRRQAEMRPHLPG